VAFRLKPTLPIHSATDVCASVRCARVNFCEQMFGYSSVTYSSVTYPRVTYPRVTYSRVTYSRVTYADRLRPSNAIRAPPVGVTSRPSNALRTLHRRTGETPLTPLEPRAPVRPRARNAAKPNKNTGNIHHARRKSRYPVGTTRNTAGVTTEHRSNEHGHEHTHLA
jgi:hypothetical protein